MILDNMVRPFNILKQIRLSSLKQSSNIPGPETTFKIYPATGAGRACNCGWFAYNGPSKKDSLFMGRYYGKDNET
jgi:hypothetical protein